MNTLRALLASLVLTLVLSTAALAGDIGTPGFVPPPPPPPGECVCVVETPDSEPTEIADTDLATTADNSFQDLMTDLIGLLLSVY